MVQSKQSLWGLSVAFVLAFDHTAWSMPHRRSAPSAFSKRDTKIDWQSCGWGGNTTLDCATLEVPLDYTDPTSNQTLELSLIRSPATSANPRNQSILFNPGGPGGSGIAYLAATASAFHTILGDDFDIVSWDPRGVNTTLPFVCFDSSDTSISYPLIQSQLLLPSESDTAAGLNVAGIKLKAEICAENAGDVGQNIGTAFVVQDMMQIIDSLGEDGMLRYWGFSYGTVLGTSFATMYPDRVDKVVLDGVANSHLYYEGPDPESVTDTDAALAGFFSGCIATPANCSLTQLTPNATVQSLTAQWAMFMDKLKYNPILSTTGAFSYVTEADVRGSMFSDLYAPGRWPDLATSLGGLYLGNTSQWELYGQLYGSKEGKTPDALLGILCSDRVNKAGTTNLTAYTKALDEFVAVSTFGGETMGFQDQVCDAWQLSAKQSFQSSDFVNVTTSYPLLIVGNTFDPVTPLVSAQNTSCNISGERTCSAAQLRSQPSMCTFKLVKAYFVNGTLPDEGTVCQPNFGLFSKTGTVRDRLGDLIPNPNPYDDNSNVPLKSKRTDQELDEFDAKLMEALQVLTEYGHRP